jgi:hypothetical protein
MADENERTPEEPDYIREEPDYIKEKEEAEDRAHATEKEKRLEESSDEDRKRERTIDSIVGDTFLH